MRYYLRGKWVSRKVAISVIAKWCVSKGFGNSKESTNAALATARRCVADLSIHLKGEIGGVEVGPIVIYK